MRAELSPIHTGNNVEATLSNATSRTILSIKIECCFDKVKRWVASTLLLVFDAYFMLQFR